MSEQPDIQGEGEPFVGPATLRDANLKRLWPLAALAGAAVLLVAGVFVGVATRPRADVGAPFREAERLIHSGDCEAAIEVLNDKPLRYLDSGQLNTSRLHDLYALRADAVYLGQQAKELNLEPNNRNIVEDYERAERYGSLSAERITRLALTKLALDDPGAAAERVRSLGAESAELRSQVIRTIVERNLRRSEVEADLTLGLLLDLKNDPTLTPEDRAWTLAREAEVRIAEGYAEEAVQILLRELQRLVNVPDASLGELHLLLGEGYAELSEFDRALRHLEEAETRLASNDPLMAEVALWLGRVQQRRGNLDEARERLVQVGADYGGSEAAMPALLHLAEVESDPSVGSHEAALDAYGQVVATLPQVQERRDLTREIVRDSLLERRDERFHSSGGDTRQALAYAALAAELYAGEPAPPEVLYRLAETHRRLADELLANASTDADGVLALEQLDPVTRREAAQHYLGAGDNYRRHSRAIADTLHPTAYGDSLWLAADSYDRAGFQQGAIDSFSDFRQQVSPDDPRHAEAKFRLGKLFQSRNEFETAASFFRELVDARLGESRTKGIGIWGDRAIVPLAQCELMDGDATDDAQAIELLRSIVEGDVLGPEAPEFRDALVELGARAYEQEQTVEAIERLTEALERYPNDRISHRLTFMLADSQRISAEQMADRLDAEALPPAEREELASMLRSRLEEAIGNYERYLAMVAEMAPSRTTDVDRVYARNAAFSLGDCSYDLGRYPEAIQAYEAARQRYSEDPASLVAMVQIVNAYVAQGMWAEANAAHRRAQTLFEKLRTRVPDEMWTSRSFPMEKKHWERWLESRLLLERQTAVTP